EHEDAEHEESEYDEHVWTSPVNAIRIAQVISDTLCALDGDRAETYRRNTAAYTGKLQELDASFRAVTGAEVRNTLVFGDRFPFRYFVDEYGFDYYAAFPGCSTETEASAKTVAFLIDKVRAERIPVVFHIEFSNGKIADTICESTGAVNLLFHSCHNVTKAELEQGITYLELMTRNVEQLKKAVL
ncbi:MAG: metal ABC transporter substrate-binding protein, partial [Spirochaetaceae bacterium]|nr:metal ABC transporter substrate-binding protein [Spirochaetaceae bacterium]